MSNEKLLDAAGILEVAVGLVKNSTKHTGLFQARMVMEATLCVTKALAMLDNESKGANRWKD